jgi:DNA-binding NarL/FixJ family response regulator
MSLSSSSIAEIRKRMIKVALFDDSREQRDALRALLNAMDTVTCVGAFVAADNVVGDVESCEPDVVLMDIDMPMVDGIQATGLLRARFPVLRIIMLTVIEDDDRIFTAIRAGADGYFLKQTPPLKLVEGIVEAMDGGAPMTPSIARRVLRMMEGRPAAARANEFKLTDREQEILALLVKGQTYKRIAADLGVSFATVNKHVTNVYAKLRVHSVGEAVALAVRKGLI